MKNTVLCALSGLPAARPVDSTHGVPSSGLPSAVSYGLSANIRPVMPVAAIRNASSSFESGCGFSADVNENVPERNDAPAETRRDRLPNIASHSGYSRAAFMPLVESMGLLLRQCEGDSDSTPDCARTQRLFSV